MLQAFHKLHPKPKTIPELNSALQQIWDDLPQTTINKVINDFANIWTHAPRPVSAGGGHFEQTIWALYRNILTELCLLFQKKFDKLFVFELSYCKQIARQLHMQYVEGIYDNPMTLKCRLSVTWNGTIG